MTASIAHPEPRTEPGPGSTPLSARLGRPHFVFLYICVVYLAFPSRDFNVDALHYNMRALLTAADASALFSDISVPVHLAWHVVAAGLLRLVGLRDPLQTLYLLEVFNIVVALASIYLFLRLVRSFADDFVTSCATLVLAFSYACLRYFLSVEVYALNNLALIALVAFVYRCCADRVSRLGHRQVTLLALMTMLAITTHLSNLLLLPTFVAFFFALDWRRAWVRSGIYLGITLGLLGLLVAWISSSTAVGWSAAIDYLFGYTSGTGRYAAAGPLQSAAVFLREAPTAALGSYGRLLYIPLAAFSVYVVRNARALWALAFVRFLGIHLAAMILFYSQWDAANVEHKIAILPTLLLLVVYAHAKVGRGLATAGRAAVGVLVAGFVVIGFVEGILPFRNLQDQPLYRLSSAIHDVTGEPKVVVIGLSSEARGHPVVMAAMTFFGQEVHLLESTDEHFESKLRAYRGQGMAALTYDDRRFRRLP